MHDGKKETQRIRFPCQVIPKLDPRHIVSKGIHRFKLVFEVSLY